ncbi:MAG: type I methionyl aminopeptidase [Verrucomicrobia bacterium]|nr:type I methionyl aminopeptidase [Verrucomicrobiota bacterium]
MIAIRGAAELEIMRESCGLAARVRDQVAAAIRPGVTTLELSELAGALMRAEGGESAFLGYHGYPGIICTSVNDAVVHGIPNDRQIVLGDIVSIDIGVRHRGYIGDTATTVMVGVTDPEVVRMVTTTQRALEAGIAAARAGNRVSDISHAIEQVALEAKFGVVRDFVGHGVGQKMHEEPQVPNFGPPGRGPVLKAGMTLALEPMLNMGRAEVRVLDDGWTVVTRDGKPAAHFEHTIAVRDDEAEILTQ